MKLEHGQTESFLSRILVLKNQWPKNWQFDDDYRWSFTNSLWSFCLWISHYTCERRWWGLFCCSINILQLTVVFFFILFFFLLSVCKACVWECTAYSRTWILSQLNPLTLFFVNSFGSFGNASDCFNWHSKQKPVKKKRRLSTRVFFFSILWVHGLVIIHKRT